jgi:hypothetical protein
VVDGERWWVGEAWRGLISTSLQDLEEVFWFEGEKDK